MGLDPLTLNLPYKYYHPETKEPTKWHQVVTKVKEIFILIIKVGIGTLAFAINPTIFSIGFIVGIVFEEKMIQTINKIIIIWKKQNWVLSFIVCTGMFLSLPVSFAVTSILYGGYIGCNLSRHALKQWKGPMPF